MFEFLIVFLLVVFALTLVAGAASALLHTKYGHIPAVARIADAFAAVSIEGARVILGPFRLVLSRFKQLDDQTKLPPNDRRD